MKKIFCTVISLLAAFTCHAEKPDLSKQYVDSLTGVAFNYPSSWAVRQQRTNAFQVMVANQRGLESCMLTTGHQAELRKITSDQFANSLKPSDVVALFKQGESDLNIVDFKATKIGNRPAVFYEGKSIYQSLNSRFPIQTVAVILKLDDRIFTLGCLTHESAFAEAKPTLLNILKSLTIRL